MGYFIVPINDGVLDIDYEFLFSAIALSSTAYVALRPGHVIRETWTAITEADFNQVKASLPSGEEEPPLETRVTNLETVVDTIVGGA